MASNNLSTVVTLPPHGIHVYINNRFREYNAPSTRFRVPTFNGTGRDGSFLVQVRKVIIDNYVPNITDQCNTVTFSINGVLYTIVLQTGNYSVDRLVAAFNTEFTARFGTSLVMVFDSATYSLVMNVPAGCVFIWVKTMVSGLTTQARWDLQVPQDRLLSMMGFLPQAGISYTNTTLVATYPLNLKPTKAIDINVSFNLKVLHSDPKNWQTMVQVPILVNYGETQVYMPNAPPTFPVEAFNLENMLITMTDEFGQLLSLPDNASMLMHLVLFPQAG